MQMGGAHDIPRSSAAMRKVQLHVSMPHYFCDEDAVSQRARVYCGPVRLPPFVPACPAAYTPALWDPPVDFLGGMRVVLEHVHTDLGDEPRLGLTWLELMLLDVRRAVCVCFDQEGHMSQPLKPCPFLRTLTFAPRKMVLAVFKTRPGTPAPGTRRPPRGARSRGLL